MPDAPVFSKERDLDAAAAALRPWLARHLGVDDVEVGGFVTPTGAGASNETLLFEARTSQGVEELVLRAAPRPEYQMFMEPEFRMQYDLLVALRRNGSVKVPEALWYEEDESLLGQEFFVMRRMRGQVPVSMPVYNSTGWVFEATPEQRRTFWLSAMEQLAAIHLVPVDEVRFVDRPERGVTGVEQQVTYWTTFATWALADAIPDTVATILEWLAANVPVDTMPGLSWGDARVGNMMFGDDFRVIGVMDWEQASLAGPMADLGWWLHFDDIHSVEQGIPRLDGLGTRQETIDLWEELTGKQVEDLLWHEVFAGVKTGLLAMHSRSLMSLGGLAPTASNMFMDRSCRLLDLPVVTG